MPELMNYVDLVIANEEDCQKCLGIEADVDVTSGSLDIDKYRALSQKMLAQFLQSEISGRKPARKYQRGLEQLISYPC